MSIWCTACNDKRDCYECGKMVSNGTNYSFDEIVLHRKKCDIFITDKDKLIFDSLDCLEKYLRKQKSMLHNGDVLTLHVERCNLGDGKCMPYFKNDFTFTSTDELLSFLPKLKQMAGFQIDRMKRTSKTTYVPQTKEEYKIKTIACTLLCPRYTNPKITCKNYHNE